MITENELRKLYGFETSWASGKGSGTCFSSSHNTEIVESIRHGLDAGLPRVELFGPVVLTYAYHGRMSVADLQGNLPLCHTGGVGPYLAPGSKVSWATHLADALFDLTVVKGGPNGGGHEAYPCMTVSALKIPTLDTLIEILDLFVANGQYTHSVSISAYFLLDSTVPTVTKTCAWNAAYGGLRGGMKRTGRGYVEPTAWARGNPAVYTMLETFLRSVCQEFWGLVPPYATLAELCGLFWMSKRSKKRAAYCNPSPMLGGSPGRKAYNTVTGLIEDAPGGEPAGHGWQNTTGSWSRRWEQDWNNGTTGQKRQRIDYGPGPLPFSRLQTMEYSDWDYTGPGQGDLRCIVVTPYSVDTMTVGWVDGSQYALQFVSKPRTGTTVRHWEIDDACAAEWNSQMHSRLLTVMDWNKFPYNSTGDVTGDGGMELGMRWHKKGTPFVGQMSLSTLKNIRKQSRKYGWILE